MPSTGQLVAELMVDAKGAKQGFQVFEAGAKEATGAVEQLNTVMQQTSRITIKPMPKEVVGAGPVGTVTGTPMTAAEFAAQGANQQWWATMNQRAAAQAATQRAAAPALPSIVASDLALYKRAVEDVQTLGAAVTQLNAAGQNSATILARFKAGIAATEAETGKAIPLLERTRAEIALVQELIARAAPGDAGLKVLEARLASLNMTMMELAGKGTQAHMRSMRALNMQTREYSAALMAASFFLMQFASSSDEGSERQKRLKTALTESTGGMIGVIFAVQMLGGALARFATPVGLAVGAMMFLIDMFKKTDYEGKAAAKGLDAFAESLVGADKKTLAYANLALTDLTGKLEDAEKAFKKQRDYTAAGWFGLKTGGLRELFVPKDLENMRDLSDKLKQMIADQNALNDAAEKFAAEVRATGNAYDIDRIRLKEINNELDRSGLTEVQRTKLLNERREVQGRIAETEKTAFDHAKDLVTIAQRNVELGRLSEQAVIASLWAQRQLAITEQERLDIEVQIQKVIDEQAKKELDRQKARDDAQKRAFASAMTVLAKTQEMELEAMGDTYKAREAKIESEYDKRNDEIRSQFTDESDLDDRRAALEANDSVRKLAYHNLNKQRATDEESFMRELTKSRLETEENERLRTWEQERVDLEDTHRDRLRMIGEWGEKTGNILTAQRLAEKENTNFEQQQLNLTIRQKREALSLVSQLTGDLTDAGERLMNLFQISADTFVGGMLKGLSILQEMVKLVETIKAIAETIAAIKSVFSLLSFGAGGLGGAVGGAGKVVESAGTIPANFGARNPVGEEGAGLVISGTVDISNGKLFLRQEMPTYEKFAKRKTLAQ